MIQVNETFDASGIVSSETIDTVAGTATYDPPLLDDLGEPLPPRLLTPDEIAVLEGRANSEELIIETGASIDKLIAVVEALNTITAMTNASINANAAPIIKDVARELKTVARQLNRQARLAVSQTDSTFTGAESP